MTLPEGFVVEAKAHEGEKFIILRARRLQNNSPLILKLSRQEYPDALEIMRLNREYELLRQFESAGTIKAIEFIANSHPPVLALEDFGGKALEDLMEIKAFGLDEFLEIALQTAQALESIHNRGIVHNRINPGHILYNPDTRQINICGFGAAFTGSEATMPENDQSLAYKAPEQTGRLNWKVDFRTDLYSLGIVFYRLLTGKLPFTPDDLLAGLSFHLAKEALPIDNLVPEIPIPIAKILAKLMAKNPDQRYQNAKLLVDHLQTVIEQWRQGLLETGIAGEFQTTEPFKIPTEIYGREAELNLLFKAFHRTCRDGLHLILVSGDSGVGKTSLVSKFKNTFLSNGAFFSSGKPDQYLQHVPYSIFAQVLQSLVQIILTEDEEGLTQWRRKLESGPDQHFRLLTELVPELEKVIGPGDPLPSLPLAEARNRFDQAIIDFLRLYPEPARPLVIFLDDLQWAPESDFRLLETVLASHAPRIMIIGAYRSDEVRPGGPLEHFLTIAADYGPYETINLSPLSIVEAEQLIRETLDVAPGVSADLTAVCLQKTNGNPFYLKQFLSTMWDQGLIRADPSHHGWSWDEQAIVRMETTNNVIDLTVLKFERLHPQIRMVLETAACIGFSFDLETLATVTGKSPSALEKTLRLGIKEALILPEEPGLAGGGTQKRMRRYRFIHDRIHQTAYSLIPNVLKEQYHLRIGRTLWQRLAEDAKEERLYEITAHFNLARAIIDDEGERLLLAELNRAASVKAKTSSAYENELEFAVSGIDIFQESWWERHYRLGLDLHVLAAEAAMILGKFELTEQYANSGLTKVKTVIDSVEFYRIKIEAYATQDKIKQALATANIILKKLGASFPNKPTRYHVWYNYQRLRRRLRSQNFAELFRLPQLSDPRLLAIIKIINTVRVFLYFLHSEQPYLLYLQHFFVLEIFLKHGNSSDAAMFYVIYAFFLCGFVQDYRSGYQFGRLALEMAAGDPPARSWEYQLKYCFNSTVLPFGEPLQNSIAPDICHRSLQYGDWRTYIYTYMNILFGQFFSGQPVPVILDGMKEFQEKTQTFRGQIPLDFYGMYRQLLLNLCGETEDPKRLVGAAYDETQSLRDAVRLNFRPTIFAINFFKLYLNYLFGAFPEAIDLVPTVEAYQNSFRGLYYIPLARFYTALVLLSGDPPPTRQRRFWKKINRTIEDLQKLARSAPENFQNKTALLMAERARVKGDTLRAGKYYDQAIAAAEASGNLPEIGLANELAARLWLARRSMKVATVYLKEAHYAYGRWGAKAKVAGLEREYPEVFWFQSQPVAHRVGRDERYSPPSSGGEPSIDFLAVIRAGQAISEAPTMEELLRRLIRILLQDSGASRAVFLANRDGRLQIEAEGDVRDESVRILQGTPLEESDLPRKLIRYCGRIRESVLWEAVPDGIDFDDPYLQTRELLTALCLPVLANKELIGVLYLENNLLAGVFSYESRELLKLLAAQLAISIEKARRHETLEATVAARTEELHRKNEELVLVNTQLAAANAAKNELIANVSHEIRTPLQGIIGMLSLLEKTTADSNHSEYLRMLGNSAQSLREIVDDILDLAKIEAKQISLECKVFDIRQLAEEAAGVFTSEAAAKGLELSCVCAPQIPRLVMGDPLRLRQIMVNLISNAVKYSDQGTVRLSLDVDGIGADYCRLIIEVRDTGIGIPPDKLESIFEAFTQVDSGVSRRLGGVGLGLSITKSLVELMQGKIEVASEPGRGSRFRCTVSLGIAPKGSLPQTNGDSFRLMRESGQLAGLRVIVAEDNPVNRKYLEDILGLLGCRVRLAANGREALDMLSAEPCDCLFIDQNMPELNGTESICAIRSQERRKGLARLPVVALTAAALTGEKESLLDAGADYYLAKPVREDRLLAVLRQIKGIRATSPETAAGFKQAAPEVAAGLIDARSIMEEAESLGPAVIWETLSELAARYPEQLAAVARDMEDRDYPGLQQTAHRLAGTFANAFAPGLQKIARRIELAAAAKTKEEAEAAYMELVRAAAGFPEELAEVIAKLKG